MTQVLVGQNSPPIVAAAMLLAVLTAYVALELSARLAVIRLRARAVWLTAGSLALGAGIWSTHFVAVLGLHLPVRVEYDPALVALSMLVAVTASAFGLVVLTRGPSAANVVIGALTMGSAIVGVHYIGLEAMLLDARLEYDAGLIASSLVIALVGSAIALWIAYRLREIGRDTFLFRLLASAVMGSAVLGMHYMGMEGVEFVASTEGAGPDAPDTLGTTFLAALTVAATLLILVCTLIITALDRHLRSPGGLARSVSPKMLWGCLALTVVAVATLGALNYEGGARHDESRRMELDAVAALAEVRHLDETLTMTARLAALSGDPDVVHEYTELEARMEHALQRLRQVTTATRGRAAVDALAREDARLTVMERAVLAAAGTPRAASTLATPDYQAAKRSFATTLAAVSDSIGIVIASEPAKAHRRATLGLAVAIGTVLLVALAWGGLVLLLRSNIAEQRSRGLELQAAKEMAEAANRSKGEFLASMSHELRTPLTAVIGFANILQKNKGGRLGATDLEYVARIQRSGRHLLALINEVLDLARLESGRMEVQIAPVELGALLREAVALSVGRAEGRVGIKLDVPSETQWVESDAAKLTQIVINLIGNAVKFTERGHVTVRLAPLSETADTVRITVADTGIGIPRDRLEAIFHPFEQADNTTARQFGGTGLGLAISRTMAAALGGTLVAASEVGVGSVFTIELPRRATSEVPAALTTAPVPRPTEIRGRRRVLVIDDDADARRVIAHQIEEAGAEALLATSGDEGLRMARELLPDAITLDLIMPGKNGMDVLRTLKADPTLARIPVIVVSVAAADVGSLLGAVDVVTKPLEPKDLRGALQRQLGALDGGLEVLVVEDDPEMQALIAQHLRDEGATRVHVANEGAEALALLEVNSPQLVVLDLFMPGMSGISFLRALRLDVRWSNLPVIVVTGQAPGERESQLLELEAMTVLRKGDDIGDRLRRQLRAVIPHGRRVLSDSA